MTTYQEWRRRLHELQLKIDEFDENWDFETQSYSDYKIKRQPLVDALHMHYEHEKDFTS